MDSRNMPLRFIARYTERYHARFHGGRPRGSTIGISVGIQNKSKGIGDRFSWSLIDLQFPKDGSGVL
jgi:hypothetical protein